MTSLQILSHLIEMYGMYGVFVLVMLEGDLTLLLAGVLAHTGFFDDGLLKGYGFPKVVLWGTLAGFASDNLAYGAGRAFSGTVRTFRFYRHAQARLERLTNRFGTLSIFISKYVYGLRWAACTFYGITRMPYLRFVPLSLGSCFVWVCLLSGVGYFFSSAVMGLIGDFRHVGKILLGILIGGVIIVYLVKRRWVSRRVEDIKPERLQQIEHKAIESVREFKDDIKEKIHLK
ncbi:MAG TPA: DedA family protein [Pyrinomonadaceae bacterium]|nr:DedA family protein [Pyrinomonadaceae bacterium]